MNASKKSDGNEKSIEQNRRTAVGLRQPLCKLTGDGSRALGFDYWDVVAFVGDAVSLSFRHIDNWEQSLCKHPGRQ